MLTYEFRRLTILESSLWTYMSAWRTNRNTAAGHKHPLEDISRWSLSQLRMVILQRETSSLKSAQTRAPEYLVPRRSSVRA